MAIDLGQFFERVTPVIKPYQQTLAPELPGLWQN